MNNFPVKGLHQGLLRQNPFLINVLLLAYFVLKGAFKRSTFFAKFSKNVRAIT